MRLTLTVLCAACALYVAGAGPYDDALASILVNNPDIKAAEAKYGATVADNATGLAPDDPEVGFAYLWGEPGIGQRKDVEVTQSLDFPTVYAKRRRLSRVLDRAAQAELDRARLDVLTGARELLVEAVRVNALEQWYASQCALAGRLAAAYETMYRSGDAIVTERNKASAAYANLRADSALNAADAAAVRRELTRLNGGAPLAFDASAYEPTALPADFDAWYAAVEDADPELRALAAEVAGAETRVSLARAEGLPKLSAGFRGEYVPGGCFSGFSVGVSVPLWQNRHRVRAARAGLIEAQQTQATEAAKLRSDMQTLYDRAVALDGVCRDLERAFAAIDNAPLLAKAFEQGSITLHDYLDELQQNAGLHLRLLDAQRDRELAAARIAALSAL